MSARKYFGTDGVRGEVGQAPITPDFVLRLGYAAGQVLINHDSGHRPGVLINKDTRISGYMLEAALQNRFCRRWRGCLSGWPAAHAGASSDSRPAVCRPVW